MIKKGAALLMALALCLTLLPASALAAEAQGQAGQEQTALTQGNDGQTQAPGQNGTGEGDKTSDEVPDEAPDEEPDKAPDKAPDEEPDEAVSAVQALIDALPAAEDISDANADEVSGQLDAIDEAKQALTEKQAARLDLTSITTSAGDGRVFRPEWAERFDTVLVDAPCSGLGIIRKKPDVRYKKADDLFTLPVIQTALLDNAAQYVAPGGVLVYSTCTILPEENEQVTDAFLTEHSDFCRDGFTLPAPVGETEGQLTLWPQRHGTDGFYICRMKRK